MFLFSSDKTNVPVAAPEAAAPPPPPAPPAAPAAPAPPAPPPPPAAAAAAAAALLKQDGAHVNKWCYGRKFRIFTMQGAMVPGYMRPRQTLALHTM